MKLSDAIATGRVLLTGLDPHSFCGCALAMGLAGVGKEPCAADIEDVFERPEANEASAAWRKAQSREWPWIDECRIIPTELLDSGSYCSNMLDAATIISDLFFAVDAKQITLDQLIDWVRSVEPPEPAEQESQLPSAVGAQPGVECGQQSATDELEQARITHYELRTGELS